MPLGIVIRYNSSPLPYLGGVIDNANTGSDLQHPRMSVTSTVKIGDPNATSGNITLAAPTTLAKLTVGTSAANASTIAMGGRTLTLGNASGATGTVSIGATNGALTIGTSAGDGVLTAGSGGASTLVLDNQHASNLLTVNSVVADGASSSGVSLSKTGSGTVVLTGTNTYTGTTTVSAGTLALNNTSASNTTIKGDGNTATTDVLINGGTLKLLADEQIGNDVTIDMTSGAFDLNGKTETIGRLNNTGGTFTTGIGGHLIGTGATLVWAGGTNTVDSGGSAADKHIQISGGLNTIKGDNGTGLGGGVLQLNAPGVAPNGLEFSNGATLTLNSDAVSAGKLLLNGNVSVTDATTNTIANGLGFANHGQVDLGAGTRTFTIIASGGSLAVEADVVNGSLTKTGAGTMILTGTNTYTGDTTINNGILLVNGSHQAGTGAYSVTGGTLGGTGTITTTGTVTVDNGAIITGGKLGTVGAAVTSGDIGTLTIANAAFTLNGTYQFDVDYGNGTPGSEMGDLLSLTGGTVDLSNATFALGSHSNDKPAGSHYYIKIFESDVATAATPGQSNFDPTRVIGLAADQSIVTWDGGKTYYLVPEPASFALLGLGGALLLLRRPSRRRGRAKTRTIA